MTEPPVRSPVHLLDVNVLLALLDQAHIHNVLIDDWFLTPGLQWALCPFTETAILRFFTRPKTGEMSMQEVISVLDGLKQRPGYHYQSITSDWQTLTRPFFTRLHGHNQVTDAYLLGLAVRDNLILVTMDKTIAHMAGSEYRRHLLVLGS